MPTAVKPFDSSMTLWVDGVGGASPSRPGAGDINKIQSNLTFLASKPYARASKDTPSLFVNSLTFQPLVWNVAVEETDPAMIATVGGSTTTDHINIPYVGNWLIGVMIRAQYNNTNAATDGQIQLLKTFSSGGHPDILLDVDIQACNKDVPSVLRIVCPTVIVAADLANGPAVKVQYAQGSGGDATITPAPGGTSNYYPYPQFWARWLGTNTV